MNKDQFKQSLKHPGSRDLLEFINEFARQLDTYGFDTTYEMQNTTGLPDEFNGILFISIETKAKSRLTPNQFHWSDWVATDQPNAFSWDDWADRIIPLFNDLIAEPQYSKAYSSAIVHGRSDSSPGSYTISIAY